MKAAKRKKLETAGWKVGTAEEFLGLTPAEAEIVEMKLRLGEFLKLRRSRLHLTQKDLAERLGSSQSRIAKLEAAVRGVSLDLLFRAIFATGATADEVAQQIRRKPRRAA